MDNKTRIEKEAENYANKIVHPDTPCGESLREYVVKDYIAGANAEQERFEVFIKNLKEWIKINTWDADNYNMVVLTKDLMKFIDSK